MAYIIGVILIVITLIIIGLILRKRVYDMVDRCEAWKMDIMGRNIAGELSRIKQLNLTGETQAKFETWKERWDQIVTKELPDIEEHLFDAEEAADRYRFSKAKKTLNETEKVLVNIEEDIEKMLNEVDDLMESEESGRKEAEQIEPAIKSLRKNLSQQRYQYGKAESYFDGEIDQLGEKLADYNDEIKSGNYYRAKQLIDELRVDLIELEEEMEAFPDIYKKCKQELPSQLQELHAGVKEMKEDGYRVDHLAFEKEIRTYQESLSDSLEKLDKGDASSAKEIMPEIDERIQEMYRLLEKEAIAKNYLENQIPGYKKSVHKIDHIFEDTRAEVEELQKFYYIEDSDMERFLSLEKAITRLKAELTELEDDMENEDSSHSELREKIEQGFLHVEELERAHEAFTSRIQNLRKDEMEAKAKLSEIRNELYHTQRKLKKSNVPGVPHFIWDSMENASNKNKQVLAALENQPLDMNDVQQVLAEAENAVNHMAEQTEIMLDQAYLTEQVIQYANRYRSQYPLLAAKLTEAERLFRSYEYELSLEHAAKAVEEIEPGALKRIEEHQKTAIN
ncbi:septation ring formation regulator EzrA [Virgibacillus kimchii]